MTSATEVLRRSVVVFSKNYLPVSRVNIKRAIADRTPRSQGGTHTWDNVVTACEQCNSHKGDRTPEQAGMILRTKPKAPMHPAVAFAEQFWRSKQVNLE